jgi:hypothetical protein
MSRTALYLYTDDVYSGYYLSFPGRLEAKRWIHQNQVERRGSVCVFLRICHVLEFLPIYQAEAKGRYLEGVKSGGNDKSLESIKN